MKEKAEELKQQLAEAYDAIQGLEITATERNITALGKVMGLMRYVYGALDGITEEAGKDV